MLFQVMILFPRSTGNIHANSSGQPEIFTLFVFLNLKFAFKN